ncbi:MAG: double-strand break repair protein AddB [Alphaproteobacteria bacterium]|nr:double-strand break repair protein AddB [Alphaproteobacteria bacterium]
MGIYYTPAGYSTIDLLADYILAETAKNPLAMSKGIVFLPNRRSCRLLQTSLLEKSQHNTAILLPHIQPIGDIQPNTPIPGLLPKFLTKHPLKPSINYMRRHFLLARLITQAGFIEAGAYNLRHALLLSKSLAHLLAESVAFNLDWHRLDTIVDTDFAEHWQKTLKFLNILRNLWPQILIEEGSENPETLHQQSLDILSNLWQQHIPTGPVLVGGMPRPTPGVLKLLSAITNLPQGFIILPSFQNSQTPLLQQEIRQAPTHPYYQLFKLLDFLKQDLADLKPWPVIEQSSPDLMADTRLQFLELAMRPSSLISDWDHPQQFLSAYPLSQSSVFQADGRLTNYIQLVECPGLREESQVISLIIRDSLEKKSEKIALVTPDRQLALRVRLEVNRWGIIIDDSAGQALHQTDVGKYLRLTAMMLQPDVQSAVLLAALKHPFSQAGRRRSFFLRLTRDLEKRLLRQGFSANIPLLVQASKQIKNGNRLVLFLETLAQGSEKLGYLLKEHTVPLRTLVQAHCMFAEWLSCGHNQSASTLWSGEAGEAAANMMAELMQPGMADVLISPQHYPDILSDLFQEKTIYPQLSFNPRLYIWGLLEAQLQQADTVILAGLNEGQWPGTVPSDPWLNNRLRQQLGLPEAQETIGQMAFDFIQTCQAKHVFLTRSIKVDGTPTRPSRFLQRLQALAQAKFQSSLTETHWLEWQQQLTPKPTASTKHTPPLPCPAVQIRPKRLSVSDVQLLIDNPYEFYCRRLLKLSPLSALDKEPDASVRGSIVHRTLYQFNKLYPNNLTSQSYHDFQQIARKNFEPYLERGQTWAFWWLHFQPVLDWLWHQEERNRPNINQSFHEVNGQITFTVNNHSFILQARADRIDLLSNNLLRIIDYKTGKSPTKDSILKGHECQLPIELLIAEGGFFANVPACPVDELVIYNLGAEFKTKPLLSITTNEAPISQNIQRLLYELLQQYYNETPAAYAYQHQNNAREYYKLLSRFDSWSSDKTEGQDEYD